MALIYRKPDAHILVHGDYNALHQMIINLVLNAAEAAAKQTDPAAKITVYLEPMGDDRAALRVRDSGPGPAEDVAQRMFEPFVSGKAEGTGLGLFVARQVVEDHHGTIGCGAKTIRPASPLNFPASNRRLYHYGTPVDRG